MGKKEEVENVVEDEEIIIDSTETNTENKVENVRIKIREKEYTLEEIRQTFNKDNKNNDEKEEIKLIKKTIINYISSFIYAICGLNNFNQGLEKLKKELLKEETYRAIDIKCSNNRIKFTKATVDAIIQVYEKIILNKK